jgi:RimJ/RimL family protein N-acetyltransferase
VGARRGAGGDGAVTVLISSARLELVSPDDAELIAIRDDTRQGWQWAVDYPTEGDRLMAAKVLARGITPVRSQDPWLPLQVRDVPRGLAIGGAGFHTVPDADGVVEIGYGIAPSAQGRGVASEAVVLLIDLAMRSGARALVAETSADNIASQRVLARNGFGIETRTDQDIRWRRELGT